ncbi:hypothetical protein [Actinoplanes sp. NPDC023714]|uniref:hypothetical protein n=1 Tax=Actinoplanes sp. NPDC023714 TaxID=3154322 RepID=UPI0033C99D3C
MSLRFGVTGHRSLPSEVAEHVVAHWRRVLPPAAGLVGVSSLADGADQLFAACVLAAGGALEAVLPCADYGASLVAEGGRERFESYVRAASSVVTLPYGDPCEQGFLEAGQILVDRCDHLFAVWDGLPSRGLGGTADVVAYARARNRPVTVLWLAGATRD